MVWVHISYLILQISKIFVRTSETRTRIGRKGLTAKLRADIMLRAGISKEITISHQEVPVTILLPPAQSHASMSTCPPFPTNLSRPAQRRTCRYVSFSPHRSWLHQSSRSLETDSQQQYHTPAPEDTLPRWRATPERMKAPFRARPPRLRSTVFKVNEDPAVLDQVYTQLLGHSGPKMLTEEVKWLAVTHKSFDHGRRGFNDRLAFLGIISQKGIRPQMCRDANSK